MSETIQGLGLLRPWLAVAAAILLCGASLNDIAVRTIPDPVALGVLAIGITLRLMDGTLIPGAVAIVAVFALGAVCWRCGWLGGGDTKLLGACAILVRPGQVPQLILATALAGGVLAVFYVLLARMTTPSCTATDVGRPHRLVIRVCRVELWRIRRHSSLPYGCAITSAAVSILFAN